ncbi:PAS domain S-box protein [Bacillus coreaensis]
MYTINSEFWAMAFNHISDLVFIMKVEDECFRYVFINEPAKNYIGLSIDVIGKTLDEVMPSDTAELITRQYLKAIENKACTSYEDYKIIFQMKSDNGNHPYSPVNPDNIIYFDSKITPIFDDKGICSHLITVVRDISERKRNEIELKTLKDRYHSLFEYNFNGVYSVNKQGYINSINPSLEKITGYTIDELIGKQITPFIVPGFVKKTRGFFHKASNGDAQKFECAIYHKNGHIVYLMVMNVPIYVADQIVGVYGIVIDETESKKAELAIKESEERYRKLVEFSPAGIVVHREGKILYANRSALNVMKEIDLKDQSIFSYIHPDYHEVSKKRISNEKVGSEIPNIEIQLVRRDGEIIYADVGGMAIIYDGSSAFMTLFKDVSQRKYMEQVLIESEEKYRLIADNMTDLVSIVDIHGIMKYLSPSHQMVLGHSPEVYEGQSAFSYIHPEEIEELQHQFMDILKNKETKTVEFRHLHVSGEWIWVEAKATPVMDDEGTVLHVQIVAREITERKLLEGKLRFMAFHDILTELPNRRMFKAKLEEILEEANRYDRKFAVLYMDMDKFKHINDTYGHDIGDELLKQFSKKVKDCLRKSDMLARIGGDEFCALLKINQEKDVLLTAQRILDSIQAKWKIREYEFFTTSSIGIAVYEHGFGVDELIKNADLALYQAKEKGRNNYQIYSSLE